MELSLDINKRYSYADYLTWIDDRRRELINGFVNMMSPASTRKHQEISKEILLAFGNYLRNKPCKVFHAPFDVRLPNHNETSNQEIFTVVQPDISVICDNSKLDERGCIGAPDLIIEIVSPASAQVDTRDKFQIYQDSGVREYWIVFPEEKVVQIFLLTNGKYELRGMYAGDSFAPVSIFNDDFMVDVNQVFKD
jgi:Uma2 family endonuclease